MSFETMNSDAKKAREVSDRKAAFERWMGEPLVRMSISSIPAGEQKDGLHMLLQSAFEAGHGCGQGAMAGSFLEAILTGREKRGDKL